MDDDEIMPYSVSYPLADIFPESRIQVPVEMINALSTFHLVIHN